jgi:type IV pilus modification protein PilV
MKRLRRSSIAPPPAGFSLIELLVALCLLGTGLLAIAHLEIAAIQRNGAAFDAQLAMTVAQTLAERMRDNRTGVGDGAYGDGSIPSANGPDCASTSCTPAVRAPWDLRQAWTSLRSTVSAAQGFRGLPDAGLHIQCVAPCTAASAQSVTVTWTLAPGSDTATPCGVAGRDCIRLVMAP